MSNPSEQPVDGAPHQLDDAQVDGVVGGVGGNGGNGGVGGTGGNGGYADDALQTPLARQTAWGGTGG